MKILLLAPDAPKTGWELEVNLDLIPVVGDVIHLTDLQSHELATEQNVIIPLSEAWVVTKRDVFTSNYLHRAVITVQPYIPDNSEELLILLFQDSKITHNMPIPKHIPSIGGTLWLPEKVTEELTQKCKEMGLKDDNFEDLFMVIDKTLDLGNNHITITLKPN